MTLNKGLETLLHNGATQRKLESSKEIFSFLSDWLLVSKHRLASIAQNDGDFSGELGIIGGGIRSKCALSLRLGCMPAADSDRAR